MRVHPPAPEPNVNGYTPRYVSPHGCVSGLRDRLALAVERLRADRTLPFVGLGLIEDLEVVLQLLNLREFAEWLRVSGAPEHRSFALDILADQDTVAATRQAVDTAGHRNESDPVRAIEKMDDEIRAVRRVLIECGALASDDETTSVPALLRALLS